MIRLEVTIAAVLYIGISLLLLLVWFFFEGKRTFVKRHNFKESLWQCSLCFSFYIDSKRETISQCPQCKALNSRKDFFDVSEEPRIVKHQHS
ncbi:MAG: hypothetical protein WDA18_08840 [Candidatus Ratteibacteria bacterium]|jgi:hypothetical protein